ncbi:asparagine synthase (glutamine-hydrolyzing) [Acidiferrobacter thiooxydans]|uniref:asparagine synthase (glutamine-hydrolyzing) n=1 Tax=Acidiferrobacter thiooxydans TaxID=163359 RepID=UPI000825126F|nr:asparagine synthase (glutamine-hydrolyzing) [Acidiferrobacter thiooxydans]UEN99870.1 asparagine synthase (glutamine-hydrolyzing) [Acidiferrobacter thiooxydans]
MCGIGGFVGRRVVDPGQWGAMLGALKTRGPDAQKAVMWDGSFRETDGAGTAGLLHARLSIRDPRPEADQPMANARRDIWICFNGEVYGYEADRAELIRQGYAFRTTSDTEFILYAYEAWGDAFIERLRGMFALVILDLRSKRLFAARDRLGLKPLLYYADGGDFAFASTLRALVPYLGGQARIAPEAVDAYLAHRYIPAPQTLVRGIKRLANGTSLVWEFGEGRPPELRRYWQPHPAPGDFRETLDKAVALRTASDRPVGIFLSGGIDSAVVASSLVRQGYTNITAFTATFPGTAYDEGPQAARMAKALGLAHRAIPVEPRLADDFDRIVADLDEPFADPSALPLWYLARAASAEVKVVLGGDGGDELFAGYKRYRQHLRSRWRGSATISLAYDGLPWEKPARWREELGLTWQEAYVLRFSGLSPAVRRYLQPDLPGAPAVHWRDFPSDQRDLAALLAIDFANYLPEYILRKGDLCTMAHGLELRAPLLDHRFVDLVTGLPANRRFTRPAKAPLVETCQVCRDEGLLTAKKRGFSPPLNRWLREDLFARLPDLGARLGAATGGQLRAERVDTLVAAYIGGLDKLAEPVYQLLVLDVALRSLGLAA